MAFFDDKRSFNRVRVALNIKVRTPSSISLNVTTYNISVGGCAVVFKFPMSIGVHTITIPYIFKDELKLFNVNAIPVNNTFLKEENAHLTGFKFVDMDVQTFNRLEYLADNITAPIASKINSISASLFYKI